MSPSKAQLETGTSALTGLTCFAITIVADTIFTVADGLSGDSFAGITFPAGLTIYGNFTAITLASGKVLIYLI